MKTKEKEKSINKKTTLTTQEKEHMKLVQKSVDHGVYNPQKSKDETLRNATEIALKRRSSGNRNEQV